MKIRKQSQIASVSPLVLATACGLLAVIIGTFAVNNFQREKQLMTEILLQKGVTIIRSVTANSRGALLAGVRNDPQSLINWKDYVQRIMLLASEHPGVDMVALIAPSGVIVSCSQPEKIGKEVDSLTQTFVISSEANNVREPSYRFSTEPDKQIRTFQVSASFRPVGRNKLNRRMFFQPGGPKNRGHMAMMNQHHPGFQNWMTRLEEIGEGHFVVLVQLEIDQFLQSIRRQKIQIIILSLILLLVGVGGWLSLLTLGRLKGSQTRLSRMRVFTDLLVSSLPIGLVATNRKGRIQLCNTFARELCSLSEKDIIGKVPSQILPSQFSDFLQSGADSESVSVAGEVILTGSDRENLTLQVAEVSIKDDKGHSAGHILILQDISEIKILESEVRRNERLAALGKMAAGVAHELRNPLSSIKGLALLLRSRFAGTSSDYQTADILVQEVERLNRSITELLHYARPEKLVTTLVSPDYLIDKALALIRVDAESSGVIVEIECAADLPGLEVDEDKLNQVFLNLFINAIQAMGEGGRLSVVVMLRDNNVLFQVEDNGCGTGEDERAKVFDPYFTTKPDGTGLGLALSAKIVEEHGGVITFDSVKGQGTTVGVLLPVGQALIQV